MITRAKSELVSIADYLNDEATRDEKHEFVGGYVFPMPSRSNRHNAIAGNAQAIFHSQLRGKPSQTFGSNTKIRIKLPTHNRFYYPDAMVVCHPNPATDHFQDQPVVVVEVLSDSTRRADLGEKRDAYLTISSLKVLLFVEADTASVTIYRRRLEGGFAIEHHDGPERTIPLPEIEATLRLNELYIRAEVAG